MWFGGSLSDIFIIYIIGVLSGLFLYHKLKSGKK
jgi:hypothetical protein